MAGQSLERGEGHLSWDFRGFWARRVPVVVTMSERAVIRTVVGRVQRVASTGAFAVVDGWHLPMSHVLRVASATVEDEENYQRVAGEAKASAREVQGV